jgi:hypothetical protein
MISPLVFLIPALALAPAWGQAVAVTSSDGLADAIRAGSPEIRIESRITGLPEEMLPGSGAVHSLERYGAFPRVLLPPHAVSRIFTVPHQIISCRQMQRR